MKRQLAEVEDVFEEEMEKEAEEHEQEEGEQQEGEQQEDPEQGQHPAQVANEALVEEGQPEGENQGLYHKSLILLFYSPSNDRVLY